MPQARRRTAAAWSRSFPAPSGRPSSGCSSFCAGPETPLTLADPPFGPDVSRQRPWGPTCWQPGCPGGDVRVVGLRDRVVPGRAGLEREPSVPGNSTSTQLCAFWVVTWYDREPLLYEPEVKPTATRAGIPKARSMTAIVPANCSTVATVGLRQEVQQVVDAGRRLHVRVVCEVLQVVLDRQDLRVGRRGARVRHDLVRDRPDLRGDVVGELDVVGPTPRQHPPADRADREPEVTNAGATTPYAKILAIEDYLKDFTYDTHVARPASTTCTLF